MELRIGTSGWHYPGGRGTWEWNGAAWSRRSISGPSARSSHSMAFDSARAVTVYFGDSDTCDLGTHSG